MIKVLIIFSISIILATTQECKYVFTNMVGITYDNKFYSKFEEAVADCDYEERCFGIGFNSRQMKYFKSRSEAYALSRVGPTYFKRCSEAGEKEISYHTPLYDQKLITSYSECIGDCVQFETLVEAMVACSKSSECQGVTYSLISEHFSFTLRKGELNYSSQGETSWVKQI